MHRLCWLFVFSVVLFDLSFTVWNWRDMGFIEENPVQRFLFTVGGFWLAAMFRMTSVFAAYILSNFLQEKNRLLVARLMVLIHVWLVISYVAFLWIVEIESARIIDDFRFEEFK